MKSINEQGFSLLEILVAVVVISIGLLGIASLQASAISATTASGMRGEAAINSANLTALMRANKAYWDEQAVATGSQTITVSVANDVSMTGALSFNDEDCLDQTCSPEELAAYDLANWARFFDSRFINATTVITLRSVSNDLLTIELSWIEKANSSLLNSDNNASSSGTTKSYTVLVSL